MDVPIGWTLLSSSYTGTVAGFPVSGSGTVVGTNPTACDQFWPTSPGYQRIYVSTAEFPIVYASDSATLSITFVVQGAPGDYTLNFWLGAMYYQGSGCSNPTTIAVSVTPAASGLEFYSVTPCRVLDTRNTPDGPLAGPALHPHATRTFDVLASSCGIPAGAVSLSTNLSVTQGTALGNLRIYPGDGSQPTVSAISFPPGTTRANNAILQLATDDSGTINVYANTSGTVHFILDVNGYFE